LSAEGGSLSAKNASGKSERILGVLPK
jgi:hypothetical protein